MSVTCHTEINYIWCKNQHVCQSQNISVYISGLFQVCYICALLIFVQPACSLETAVRSG